MTDPDPDATGATHSSPTEPLPTQGQAAGPGGPPPSSGRPRWWTWQVAVVAVVALVAGLAIGALTWSSDGDETAAVATSTTSEPPSTTTSEAPTTTAPEPGTTADQDRESEQRESEEEVREGRTVVGNSSNVFTGSYSSNRDKTTDEFTVEDNWTVRWEVDGGSITIAILDAGGNEVDTFDAQGAGETEIADGGTYRLDITTDGSRYTVVATDGP